MARAKAALANISFNNPKIAMHVPAFSPNALRTKSKDPPDVRYLAASSVITPAYNQ